MADAKAIFIDGPNLFHMGRILGIWQFKYPELFNILTKEVGNSTDCFGKPVYVLPQEQADKKKWSLARAGFEVVPMDTKEGVDDQEIAKRITKLTPDDVSEIILVSANLKDFGDCLEAKIENGIRVILVATKAIDQNKGRPMLSLEFDNMLEGIELVELKQFRDRLMKAPWNKDLDVSADAKTAESAEKSESEIDLESRLATKIITPQPLLLTKTIKLSLEVGVSDLGHVLDAVSVILKRPDLLNANLGIE